MDAKDLERYFEGKDPQVLLAQVELRSDPISLKLAEGLERIRKEREEPCFALAESWRFATRRSAARSRLLFLEKHIAKGSVIVDVSCGIGLMLRELARLEPSRLIGIEIDPVTAVLARANARLFGIDADIRTLDAMSEEAETIIRAADLVFCDPERTESAQERTLEESTPSYDWLSERSKRLAYEVSPRIEPNELPSDAIIECYSERRRHARTTIYAGFTGPSRRVVSDRGEVLEGEPEPFVSVPLGAGEELEVLDATIVHAGLSHLLGSWHESEGRYLRIRNAPISEPFIELYAIIARGTITDLHDAALELSDFGRIIIRYPVAPEEYWSHANAIRPSSSGNRTFPVFRLNGTYLLAEQVP